MPVKPDKTDNNKKKFLDALEKSNGIVSNAVRLTGLSRSQYYEWLQTDEIFKAQVDDIQEIAIDFVESKLMEKINGVECAAVDSKGGVNVYDLPPSDTAIIFYLKTKAKGRGYVETTVNKNLNYNADIDASKVKEISNKLDDSI